MYGIVEEKNEKIPSIWERRSDRSLAILLAHKKND
jgi:hypothetical protein